MIDTNETTTKGTPQQSKGSEGFFPSSFFLNKIKSSLYIYNIYIYNNIISILDYKAITEQTPKKGVLI